MEVKIETMHLTLAARLIWVIAGLKGERRSRRSLTRDPEARPIQPFGLRENVMANVAPQPEALSETSPYMLMRVTNVHRS